MTKEEEKAIERLNKKIQQQIKARIMYLEKEDYLILILF